MNFYEEIAHKLYVWNTKIGETEFEPFDFIEAKHNEAPFKGKVFYQNLIKAMPNHFGAKMRNDFFKEVLQYCQQNIKPIHNEQIKQKIESENGNAINVFCKPMPLEIAREHFKVFVTTESKNGNLFLTNEQLNSFIKRAVEGNKEIEKQTLNWANREKLFLVKRFYQFYTLAVDRYENTTQCKEKYIKLLTDNFTNWDFKNIKSNFANKVKRQW